MENFENYVNQISDALELNPDQKGKITTLFSSFKDNEKLQLISQTQDRVNELLAADEQIKALKTGSLSQYMVNIQENWNMMSENLVQLQILSLLQKKGADCSEVINDILKILNTKLTTVNQILRANLGEVSSKTTSASSRLQQEVLGKADQALAAASSTASKQNPSTKPSVATVVSNQNTTKPSVATMVSKQDTTTKSSVATKPSLASVVAIAKVDSGKKLSTTAVSETAATKAAAQLKALAVNKEAAKPLGATQLKAPAAPPKPAPTAAAPPKPAPTAAAPTAAAPASAVKPGAGAGAAATTAAPPKPASTASTASTTAAPSKPGIAATPEQIAVQNLRLATTRAATTGAATTGSVKRGGADDIYLYKYLKYKSKYLSLKNNF